MPDHQGAAGPVPGSLAPRVNSPEADRARAVHVEFSQAGAESVEITCPKCELCFTTSSGQGDSTCPACGTVVPTASTIRTTALMEIEDQAQPAGPAGAIEAPLPAAIGRFRIVGLIGEGGFGKVYRAYDPEERREVALKVPHPKNFKSAQRYSHYVEALLAEGRRAARLRHPCLVQTYEVGTADDPPLPYIAMELVEGGSLQKLLQSGRRLPIGQVVRLMIDVADGLTHAHAQQFVHRDLKPGNILLTRNGRAKVADFGLALHEDDLLRHEGHVAGTLPYMSPEQVDGKTHHLDGRTDIWSLGVMLYELLAGRRPFEGDVRQLQDSILTKPVRPLRQRDPAIPPVFDEIIERCLSKSVEGRYPTAAEVSQALRGALRRPRRTMLVACGLGGLALAAAAVGLRWRNQEEGLIEDRIAPNSWTDLPLRDVKKLYWPDAELNAKLQFDRPQRLIEVRTAAPALVELGDTQRTNWALEIGISQLRQKGFSGAFFGYRPYTGGRYPGFRFQTLGLTQASVPEYPRRLVRQIFDFTVAPNGAPLEEGFREESYLLPQQFPLPQNAKLEIEFRGGFLARVVFCGVAIKELIHPQPAMRELDLEWSPCRGKFGLINYVEHSDFRDCRVKVAAE